MNARGFFDSQLSEWSLRLGSEEVARLMGYARALADYEKANVIGTRDFDRILLDHVLDSLSCLLFDPVAGAERLIDVGSGGGLPGMPLKITRPQMDVSLLESTGKKAHFLKETSDTLGLGEISIINGRVEEVAHTVDHRSAYNVATARAVARLSVVAEYCVPLVGAGGHVISMKGPLHPGELEEGKRAARELGATLLDTVRVPVLPELGDKERWLVILKKVRRTPGKYPRRVGTPARNPLGKG
jgi:16S rRNA (guanine527-N7)-methyltransferase